MEVAEEWLDILSCPGHDFQGHTVQAIRDEINDLRDQILKLTGERDRARDLAVRSGVFE